MCGDGDGIKRYYGIIRRRTIPPIQAILPHDLSDVKIDGYCSRKSVIILAWRDVNRKLYIPRPTATCMYLLYLRHFDIIKQTRDRAPGVRVSREENKKNKKITSYVYRLVACLGPRETDSTPVTATTTAQDRTFRISPLRYFARAKGSANKSR